MISLTFWRLHLQENWLQVVNSTTTTTTTPTATTTTTTTTVINRDQPFINGALTTFCLLGCSNLHLSAAALTHLPSKWWLQTTWCRQGSWLKTPPLAANKTPETEEQVALNE
jgi:hypothetical protein